MKNVFQTLNGARKKSWQYIKSTDLKFYDVICAIVSAFILSQFITAVEISDITSIDAIKEISLKSIILITVISAAVLLILSAIIKSNTPINAALLLFSCGFGITIGIKGGGTTPLLICILIVLLIIMRYIETHGGINVKLNIILNDKKGLLISVLICAVFSIFCGIFSHMTYRTFLSNTFDFSIFAQMFEQMKKTGLMTTTVERGKELSHLAVHFSPFFYLLLPGYMLFSTPAYLYFIQAIGVGAGAIAIYKIARELEFSPNHSVIFSALYALFPSMAYGTFWDFHENKFLSVLILWCVYFIIKEKLLLSSVFALLTLSVKEDTVIYIAAIALWIIFARKKKLYGAAMLAFAVGYFFFATKMIEVLGGEAMMGRFENLTPSGEEASLLSIAKTVILDLGYVISQMFTEKKFEFILLMLIPSLFVMITHGKTSTLILLIPIILENILSNWIYQYNIYYQYTYGSAALILFATMLTLKEFDTERLNKRLAIMLVFSAVISSSLALPKISRAKYYSDDKERFIQAEEFIDKHRERLEKADVYVSSYLTPHFYFVDELYSYPIMHGEFTLTEYVIVDTRFKDVRETAARLMGENYDLYDSGSFIEIYKLRETIE